MVELLVKQVPVLKQQQLTKLMGVLKLSNLMELSEKDFKKLIREVENDGLFKKFIKPENKENKIISYRRFPGTDLSSNFLELKEEILSAKDSFDVKMLVAKKTEIVAIIKNLGMDKFKQYFLYNESSMNYEEIAGECSLMSDQVKKISEFMNDFFLYEDLFASASPSQSIPSPENRIHYQKIADVERNGDDFVINYFSPSIARGRYSIHYERFEDLRKKGFFNKKEEKKIKQLMRKMELINFRKAAVYRIIQAVIKIQHAYLQSNDMRDLTSYTQKELAVQIETKPCLICRVIRGKSIGINGKTEVSLKSLLPSKKLVRLMLIKEITDESIGDENIRTKLKIKFNISLSRRSINEYRRALKIPSLRERRNLISSDNRTEV